MGYNTYPCNPWPMSTDQKGNEDTYVLPTASADTLGGVKVGSNLSIADGVLSAPAPYSLPTASADTLGGVKVGSNLSIADGVLSAPAPYSLPTASADTLGGVKVGSGLSIADGVLSATGLTKKQKRYTGTGTNPHTIDFGADTPMFILGIIPDPDETLITSNYEFVGPIPWGNRLGPSYWSTQSGGDPTTTSGGINVVRATYSGNTVTLAASSATAASNAEGQKYLIEYI